MHTLFFGLKRSHLRALAVSRPLLRKFGLTPARFDMLRVIHVHHEIGVDVAQGKTQFLLGVSAPVVSRMLAALERLGLIVRTKTYKDARRRFVRLTTEGLRRVQEALRATVESGVADSLATKACADRNDGNDRNTSPSPVERVLDTLSRIRIVFRDPMPYRYPWRPEDLWDQNDFITPEEILAEFFARVS